MIFNKLNISETSKKVAFLGIMSSLGLVLGYLESLLPPIPFLPPGAKLGLSNILAMHTGYVMGIPGAVFVTLVKGGFTFLTRGATAGAMSLAGGLFSCIITTVLLRRSRIFGCIGIGMIGGIMHNIGQMLVAVLITSAATLAYFPALIIFGSVAGAVTGIALYHIEKAINKTMRDKMADI